MKELFNLLDFLKDEEDQEEIDNIKAFNEFFLVFLNNYPYKNYAKIITLEYPMNKLILMLLSNPKQTINILKMVKDYPDLVSTKNDGAVFAYSVAYAKSLEFKEKIDNILTLKGEENKEALRAWCEQDEGIKEEYIYEFLKFFRLYKSDENFVEYFKYIEFDEFKLSENFYIEISEINQMFFGYENEKQVNEIIKGSLNKYKNEEGTQNFLRYYDLLYKKYETVSRNLASKLKVIKKKNKRIEEVKAKLSQKKEIKDIDSLIEGFSDDIKEKIVDYVLNHNYEYYHNLYNSIINSKEKSDENLNILFNKYNFVYNSYSLVQKNNIKAFSFDGLEYILKTLNKYSLNMIDVSEVEIIKLQIIEDLIIKGVLTAHFISQNNNLLYSKNHDLQQVVANIELLNQNAIFIGNYLDNLDILLSSNLSHNLDILNIYGLTITKITTNINFLSSANLDKRIDLIISMGLFEELNSLDILNKNIEELLQLKVASVLNINENLVKFFVSSYLDFSSFIDQDMLGENEDVVLPPSILNYQINQVTLLIDSIYISIPRLIKNLKLFKEVNNQTIFYAIIYDNYYFIEEINTLASYLIPQDNRFRK